MEYILILLALLGLFVVFWWLNRPKTKELPSFEEPLEKQIQVEDFTINYIQEGKGSDLVLVHGLGASIYCWRKLVPLLIEKHRVTVVDLPGFGASSKLTNKSYDLDTQCARLYEFLEKLKIKKCTFVGCSMGGTIGLWMACRFPHLAESVVGLAPATNPKLVRLPAASFSWASSLAVRGVNRFLIRNLVQRVISKRESITDEDIEQYFKPYANNPEAVTTFLKATDTIKDPRLPYGLRGLSCPTLILYGTQDKLIPRKYMVQLKKILTNATYEEHSGGHHIMEDEPDWVYEQMQAHLDL